MGGAPREAFANRRGFGGSSIGRRLTAGSANSVLEFQSGFTMGNSFCATHSCVAPEYLGKPPWPSIGRILTILKIKNVRAALGVIREIGGRVRACNRLDA